MSYNSAGFYEMRKSKRLAPKTVEPWVMPRNLFANLHDAIEFITGASQFASGDSFFIHVYTVGGRPYYAPPLASRYFSNLAMRRFRYKPNYVLRIYKK